MNYTPENWLSKDPDANLVRVEIVAESYSPPRIRPLRVELEPDPGMDVHDYYTKVRDIMRRWYNGDPVTLPGDLATMYLDRTLVRSIWVDVIKRQDFVTHTERIGRD